MEGKNYNVTLQTHKKIYSKFETYLRMYVNI